MGLSELGQEEELVDNENITVGDLVSMYGREATRRGLEYMRSLHEADDKFRESAKSDKLERGYKEAGVRGDVTPVTDKWRASMKEEGLGLDDGNSED